MDRKFTFYPGYDKKFNIGELKRYADQKQELDKFFETLITPYIENKSLKIFDVGCGNGHIIKILNEISPKSSYLGIDQTDFVIDEAKKICQNMSNVELKEMDMYELPSNFDKSFDISINWKIVSWIPYYDELMKMLIKVTKSHIFLSGLFYDGQIDFETRTREFTKESGKSDYRAYYNIYSLPHFEKYVYGLGAKKIESFDFEIEIDLPRPPKDQLGTYTLKLENGKRFQISQAVPMFWKVIRIDL